MGILSYKLAFALLLVVALPVCAQNLETFGLGTSGGTGGGAPSGPAGGSLSGSYPDPNFGNNATNASGTFTFTSQGAVLIAAAAGNFDIGLNPTGTGKLNLGGTSPTLAVAGSVTAALTLQAGSTSGNVALVPGSTGAVTVAGTNPTVSAVGATSNLLLLGGITSGNVILTPGGSALVAIGGTNPTVISQTDLDITLQGGATNRSVNLVPTGTGRVTVAGTAPTVVALTDANIGVQAGATNRSVNLVPTGTGQVTVAGSAPAIAAVGATNNLSLIAGATSGSVVLSPGGPGTVQVGGTSPTVLASTDANVTLQAGATNRSVNLAPTGTGQVNVAGTNPTVSSSTGDLILTAASDEVIIPASKYARFSGSAGDPGTYNNGGYNFDTNKAGPTYKSPVSDAGLFIPGTLTVNTSAIGTLTNQTSLTSFGTIPNGTLKQSQVRSGRIVHIFGGGLFTCVQNASQAISLDVRFNTVTVWNGTGNAIGRANAQTNRSWIFDARVWVYDHTATTNNVSSLGWILAGFPDSAGTFNDSGTMFANQVTGGGSTTASVNFGSADQVITVRGAIAQGASTFTLQNIGIKVE